MCEDYRHKGNKAGGFIAEMSFAIKLPRNSPNLLANLCIQALLWRIANEPKMRTGIKCIMSSAEIKWSVAASISEAIKKIG